MIASRSLQRSLKKEQWLGDDLKQSSKQLTASNLGIWVLFEMGV